jgi:hypothetical protein
VERPRTSLFTRTETEHMGLAYEMRKDAIRAAKAAERARLAAEPTPAPATPCAGCPEAACGQCAGVPDSGTVVPTVPETPKQRSARLRRRAGGAK